MRICCLSVVALAAVFCGSVATFAADPAPLEYKPAATLVDQHPLRVDITDILLADATTGMTGCVSGQMKLSILAVAADGGGTVKVELTNVRQQMNGHTLNTPLPKPVLLRLDRTARLTDPPAQEAQAAGEILTQGGLPLQAVAVICAVPQLPDHPVSPGDTWQRSASYLFPGLGMANLDLSTTLVSLQEGVAILNSHLRMKVPDFQADNPVLPGQKVKVHNLVVEITDLVQQYDTVKSVVRQCGGKLKATLEATTPDLNLPLKLVAAITYGAAGP